MNFLSLFLIIEKYSICVPDTSKYQEWSNPIELENKMKVNPTIDLFITKLLLKISGSFKWSFFNESFYEWSTYGEQFFYMDIKFVSKDIMILHGNCGVKA